MQRHACTVYGALGECLHGKFVFKLARSTNKRDFIDFLREVSSKVKEELGGEKPYLVYDNASAHIGQEADAAVADMFIPLRTPPYSCK